MPDTNGENCRSVGVTFEDQKLEMQTSTRYKGNAGYTLIPASVTTITYPDARTVDLVVPRSALGDQFSPTET